MHPTLGIKIRQKFYTAIRRVERRCNSDGPMVIAYWNRHVNAWIKGLHTSVNVSLNHSRDCADAVQEDMEHSRQSGARKDEQARQIKDLQSKYKRLKSQDGAGAGGGGGGGGGIKKKTAKSAASSSADCVNFLSGKDCKIIDDDGICIFNHDGLTKGSDPDACTKRFGKWPERRRPCPSPPTTTTKQHHTGKQPTKQQPGMQPTKHQPGMPPTKQPAWDSNPPNNKPTTTPPHHTP